MTKNEIIRKAAADAGISIKLEQKAVEAFLCALSDNLQREDEVILPDFGRFVVQQYAEHRIVHPKTGEPMVIPATKRVRFKAFGNISYYSQKYRL